MTPFRFLVLLAVCIGWGLHITVIRATVDAVPVMFYVAMRMALVALLLAPFLRWHRGKMPSILAAGVCFGSMNYVFLFNGLKYTTASLGAILIETYMPIATILSVVFLGERVGWRRIMGLVLAFGGVVIILSNGGEATGSRNLPLGAVLLICGATFEAMGAILIKKIDGVTPIQLLAWFGVVGAMISGCLTLIFEKGQFAVFSGPEALPVLGALAFSVLIASIFGHGLYYWLLQRVDVSQVAGSTMLTTVIAVGSGVLLLGEPLTIRFMIGGLITMIGVLVIVLRTQAKSPEIAELLVEEETHGA